MVVMRPRRGGASLSAAIGDRRRDSEQQRRQTVKIPKPPVPVTAPTVSGGSAVYASAYSSTFTTQSGYPTMTNWELYNEQFTLAPAGGSAPFFKVTAGLYLAWIKLDMTCSNPAADLNVSANLFSDSAYVTQEFQWPPLSDGRVYGYHSFGPMSVDTDAQGAAMGVSFSYPASGGVPALSGSCTYLLAKLA